MPRYYFDVRRSKTIAPDDEGQTLADRKAAHAEAQRSARDLVARDIIANEDPSLLAVEVRDEKGAMVETVSLKDVLKPFAF